MKRFIEIEGIDRTGKDTILAYINKLTNYKYLIRVRGWLSQQTYSDLYNRDYEYINYQPIVFFLDVEEEDWEIRCALTNEQDMDYEANRNAFYKRLEELDDYVVFNTSFMTPYQIANVIVERLEKYEKDNII